jgi:hypothetical protein
LILHRNFFIQDFKHFIMPIISFFLPDNKEQFYWRFSFYKWKLTSFFFCTYAFFVCYLCCYNCAGKSLEKRRHRPEFKEKQNRLIKKLDFILLSTLCIIRVLISLYFHMFNKDIISISRSKYLFRYQPYLDGNIS